MCGIYGSTRNYPKEIIRKKLEFISFRGPDYSDIKEYRNVIFGHNRLSIIDLDSRSHQPFEYEYLSITYNGEIYNYLELKNDLLGRGLSFRTNSDTEVICAAYLTFGSECVKYLNGMFAFVIYDRKSNILFGARDRVGQKPFYYSIKNGHFEFASQPSCIAFNNSLSINENAISQVLLWKYIPEPNSIYNEIKKLNAGYYFEYNLTTKKFNKSQYWEVPDNYNSFKGDYSDAQIKLKRILSNAVEKRMISDVPLGIFLSGGIDSSIIAALAQSTSTKPIKTFSIKFAEHGFDESPYAEQLANKIGSDHLTIECNLSEGIELIKNYQVSYDEPFSDSSAIPTMLLSKHTKNYVTVALSGDGGDENFLGYHTYPHLEKISNFFTIPFPLRRMISLMYPFIKKRRWKQAIKAIQFKDASSYHYYHMRKIDSSLLINESLADSLTYKYIYERNKPLLEKASDFDFKTFVSGDANTKVDRGSMAFSLEVRSPFYDHEIIEFSRSLPIKFKYTGGNKKRILKDLLKPYINNSDFLNRKKAGFTMPFALWFQKELKDFVMDELTEKNLNNIPNLNVKEAKRIIKEHIVDKSYNHYPKIWNLIVVSKFINRS